MSDPGGAGGPLEIGFAIPGDLATISGGYGYDRRLIAEAPAAGLRLRHLPLPGGFPEPSAADLAETHARLSAHAGPLLIDGLAFGAFPESLACAVGDRTVALTHHPLCLEDGLAPEQAAALEASERAALAACRGSLVTSPATARLLVERFGMAPDRLAVAEPGVDRGPRAALDGDPPRLLAVGSVIPRKGYDLLIAALAELADLDWSLEIVGPRDRSPAHEAALLAAIDAAGLAPRIRFAGAVPEAEVPAAYARAELFVAPSRFEGYGMAAAEALVRGLPVVAGPGGALADTAAAGRIVDPADTPALAAALRELIADRAALRAAGARAWDAGRRLPTWADTARAAVAGLRRFLP